MKQNAIPNAAAKEGKKHTTRSPQKYHSRKISLKETRTNDPHP